MPCASKGWVLRFVNISVRSAFSSRVSEGWQGFSFLFGAQWIRLRGHPGAFQIMING